MTPIGLMLAGAGVILVWAAIEDRGPIDLLRTTFGG